MGRKLTCRRICEIDTYRTQEAVERSRSNGFELTDDEDLPGWGGPRLLYREELV
jgi:hypothetical protein